ncbi:MAG: hypothetical protein L0Y44_14395 [Phycisphaerales bacterium]|nr:hypothetical protein [Phycisphaerales bacterium]MCI0631833.1 hypothetical protein [Phycisphaerales bacterium]MCI0674557.1 hypothetical protein [Phycisphaerales bacterium]
MWRLAHGWQLQAWDESGQRWVVEAERLCDAAGEMAAPVGFELDDG